MRARWWRTAHGRATSHAVAEPPEPPEAAARALPAETLEPYPPAPPDGLAELLDEMRDLRLALSMDLSAAAGAAESGADRVTAEIIEADRREVAKFAQAARQRLAALAARESAPAETVTARASHSWRRRALVSLPAVPLVGAVALSAAAATGLVPMPGHSTHRGAAHRVLQASPQVASTFQEFETMLNGEPSASQVISIASALHSQIAAMLANASQDPSQVGEVAQLLQLEQALLLKKQPPGSSVVLAESRQLAAKLAQLAPLLSPSSQPTTTPTYWNATPASHHHTHSNATTTPTPTATATQAPTPATTTTQAPSPTPSSSPSSYPTRLPNIGN